MRPCLSTILSTLGPSADTLQRRVTTPSPSGTPPAIPSRNSGTMSRSTVTTYSFSWPYLERMILFASSPSLVSSSRPSESLSSLPTVKILLGYPMYFMTESSFPRSEVHSRPLGLLNARITAGPRSFAIFLPSMRTSSAEETFSPISAGLPLTVTRPASMMRSASLREATPASAMNLLRRTRSSIC